MCSAAAPPEAAVYPEDHAVSPRAKPTHSISARTRFLILFSLMFILLVRKTHGVSLPGCVRAVPVPDFAEKKHSSVLLNKS